MSTAAAFATLRPFPFCPANLSGTLTNYDVVGGLTLTQLMAFYWNLEDIEITTAGSSTGPEPHTHTARNAGTFKHNPPTITGDYTNLSEWSFGPTAMTAENVSGYTFADLPSSTHQPKDRVCFGSIILNTFASAPYGDLYKTQYFSLIFFAGLDPSDATKFAIYYRFKIIAGSYYDSLVSFSNPLYSGSSSGSYTSGTFTINGHTFNWRCSYNDNLTGASMSVTGPSFTY